jgi:hypothetical protein
VLNKRLEGERWAHDPALARVRVTPDDYGCDPVEGALVAIGPNYTALQQMNTPSTSRRLAARVPCGLQLFAAVVP